MEEKKGHFNKSKLLGGRLFGEAMWDQVRWILTPPVYPEDEEQTRIARIFNTLRLVSILVLGVFALATWLVYVNKLPNLIFLLILFGTWIISIRFMHRGRLRIASLIILVGFWVTFIIVVFLSGGPKTIIASALLCVTVFAGLLLGEQAAIRFSVLSGLATLGMVFYEVSGHQLPNIFPLPSQSAWIDLVGSLFIITITMNLSTNSFKQAIASVHEQLAERKKVEQALRDSEQKYYEIAKNTPGMVFQIRFHSDGSHYFSYASPRGMKLFGLSKDLDNKAWELRNSITPEDLEGYLQSVDQAFTNRTEWQHESRVVMPDGGLKWFQVIASPSQVGDEVVYNGILLDITGRKHAEDEMKQLNRALRATSECNQALVRAENGIALTQDICRTVVEVGGYEFAWIAFLEPASNGSIRLAAQHGITTKEQDFLSQSPEVKSFFEGFIHNRSHNLQPLIINDVRTHPTIAKWCERGLQAGLESLILFPLGLESESIGVLCIFAGKLNAFTDPVEVALLTEMASDLSFGIHTLRIREENQRNQILLIESTRKLEAAYDATLEGWANALELRERETAGHSRRVIDLTIHLAKALVLPEESIDHIRRGALLHDIGKMGIPDSILLKPDRLSSDEWVVMRQHPLYAERLLRTIQYLTQAIEIPMYHHERWDGSGYPTQLKGQYIPLAARIFSVVDVWDALTSDRPYRPAWSPQATRTYMAEQAGILFDPFIIEIFLKNV